MPIVKSGPVTGKKPVKHKKKCWTCGEGSFAFAVDENGHDVCPNCRPRLFEGILERASKTKRK